MANIFQRVVRIADGGSSGFNADVEVWWCPAITLVQGILPYVLTVNTNLVSGKNIDLKIYELSGLLGTVDQTGTGNSSSGVAAGSATAGGVDAQAHDFVVTAIRTSSGAAAPLTDPASTSNPVPFTSGYLDSFAVETSHRINTSAVTNNASWTYGGSSQYAAVIASFAASSAPTIVQNLPGTHVSNTLSQQSFGIPPTAGNALIVVMGLGPWNPSFQVTSVTDNQVQAYVPLGGLGDLEYHYR